MLNDQILDDVMEQPTKLAVKINFLQHDKDNLEERVKELSQNIYVYKRIIEKLTAASQPASATKIEDHLPDTVASLLNINDKICEKVDCLMEDIASLKCALLLKDQIMEEQKHESGSVLKNYEEKILELRRAIQDKQYAIQQRENPRSGMDERSQKDYVVDPKQETMRLNTELEELKELVRKLTVENNQLRKKNTEMTKQLTQSRLKLTKLEILAMSGICFQSAKRLYTMKQKKVLSVEKVAFEQPQKPAPVQKLSVTRVQSTKDETTGFGKKRGPKVVNSLSGPNCTNEPFYSRNQTATYLRQLLFKQKKNSEMLSRTLSELNNNYSSLVNSNKLLAESNVNYQVRRAKLQQQLNFHKRKNQQLLSIIMKKKIRLARSAQKTKQQAVLSELPPNNQVQHNYSDQTNCLRNMKDEVESSMNTLSRVATRSFFKRIKEKRNQHISISCPIDYLPRQQMDTVEQFIKKQQQKLKKQEKQREEKDNPFVTDFSMIQPQKQPVSFADFTNGHGKKRRLISQSFMQITQQILKH